MAGTGRVIASIYQIDNNPIPNVGTTGRLNNFPGALTHFYPAPTGSNAVTVNGVAMLTVIELLPSGLKVPGFPPRKYYSAADVATIQTAST